MTHPAARQSGAQDTHITGLVLTGRENNISYLLMSKFFVVVPLIGLIFSPIEEPSVVMQDSLH